MLMIVSQVNARVVAALADVLSAPLGLQLGTSCSSSLGFAAPYSSEGLRFGGE